jgi:hypothetical protein
MARVTDVEIIEHRTVRLAFGDGTRRVVDLAPFLWGPVFRSIATDDELFAEVTVDAERGTIRWSTGAELEPDLLHGDYEATRPWKQLRF